LELSYFIKIFLLDRKCFKESNIYLIYQIFKRI